MSGRRRVFFGTMHNTQYGHVTSVDDVTDGWRIHLKGRLLTDKGLNCGAGASEQTAGMCRT